MTMAETPTTDAAGGGQQPETGRTFTQADIDRVVQDRLTRERAKYADYDNLKAAADKLRELEDAQKSELERAQQAKEQAEATAKAAMEMANQRLVRAAFIAAAAQAGAAHPEDAFALADRAGVTVADDGTIEGVDVAVQTLVDAGRLVMSGKPTAPSTDAGAGGGTRTAGTVQLTPEQLEIARKMGISPDEYAKNIPKTV